jgi:hypothetical protein
MPKYIKTKICNKCGEEKSLDHFSKTKRIKSGYISICKDCCNKQSNERRKVRRIEDPEYRAKEISQSKKWRTENRDKKNDYKRKYEKDRYHNDPIHRMKMLYYSSVNNALSGNKRGKLKYLGCSLEHLQEHLESQFEDGMTLDNRGVGKGKWHVDHILPLAAAKGDEDKIIMLCHYTNLRPMWSHENEAKGDKHCPKELEAYFEERKAAK